MLFRIPVIWKEQVVLVVGAASSRDHFISRLEAAPTGVFYGNLDFPDKRLPDYARAVVDVRVADASEKKRIETCFQQIAQRTHVNGVRVETQGGIYRPPMVPSEKTLELWEQILEIGTRLGQEMKLVATGGGSDGNFTSALGIPTIDGLGPRGGSAHSQDEFIDLESVNPTVELICDICKSAAEGDLD